MKSKIVWTDGLSEVTKEFDGTIKVHYDESPVWPMEQAILFLLEQIEKLAFENETLKIQLK